MTRLDRHGITLQELEALWADAAAIWDSLDEDESFGAYVGADFAAVFAKLVTLQGRATTFLEWGSGLGVVAIMASRLGFESYGIECEPALVEFAEELAEKHGSGARFACGSFIPEEFEWTPEKGAFEDRTEFEGPAGYEPLDMQLSDFDIVYAYPWPSEHELYRNIMREFGGSHALFLSYDIRQGVELRRLRS